VIYVAAADHMGDIVVDAVHVFMILEKRLGPSRKKIAGHAVSAAWQGEERFTRFRIAACVMANANKSICIIVIVLSFRLVFAKREQGGQGRIQSPTAATGKQPKEIFLKNLQNQTCISKETMIYYL